MTMLLPPPQSAPAQPAVGKLDPFAAVLSYVVPGLGQIYQGRTFKGVLFFTSIYALFFYGMYLGNWSNVFLADTTQNPPTWFGMNWPRWAGNLYNRPHYAAQFWVGAAAWPAIWHYWKDQPNVARGPIDNWADFRSKFEAAPTENELNDLQRSGDKHWDLGWVYTVIAGVLNVLVIYDALAGAAFGAAEPTTELKKATA
ncbi:MAG: DUF6677 family protein [Gemmataceae bacterium]